VAPRVAMVAKKMLAVLAVILTVTGGLLYYAYEKSEDYACEMTDQTEDEFPKFDASKQYALRIFPYRNRAYTDFAIAFPQRLPKTGNAEWVDHIMEYKIIEVTPLDYTFRQTFNYTKTDDGEENVIGAFNRVNKDVSFSHIWTDERGEIHVKEIFAQCKPVNLN